MREPVLLVLLCLVFCGCVFQEPSRPRPEAQRSAIIEGAILPDALGFTLGELQQNAAVAMIATAPTGQKYTRCSGVLVGDRLVVAAGHCVIENVPQWKAGAQAVVFEPAKLEIVVGADTTKPLCTLAVQSVHLHPGITVTASHGWEHDLSICVLSDSAVKTCPEAIPLPINTQPLTFDRMNGELMLEGGYGKTDTSQTNPTKRYWAALEFAQLDNCFFAGTSTQQGFPAAGDSGSGALYPDADRRLRVLGVLSNVPSTKAVFARLDTEDTFLSTVITANTLCGEVDAKGTCVDNSVVTCDDDGFKVTDCTEQSKTCALDKDGTAQCLTQSDGSVVSADAGPTVDASPAADASPPPDGGDSGGCSVGRALAAGRPGAGACCLLLLLVVACRVRRRCPRHR